MRQSISHLRNKIKLISDFFKKKDIFLVFLIILTSIASFGLGKISKMDENKPSLEIASMTQPFENTALEGKYVASKNGSKYHLPWCSGAQRISDKNKIWFETKEEAESRGYLPAQNCKGI